MIQVTIRHLSSLGVYWYSGCSDNLTETVAEFDVTIGIEENTYTDISYNLIPRTWT